MSKTRNSLVFSALVAAIALSVPATGALAKPGAGGPMGMSTLAFEHFDQDADGSLTKEELRDIGAARFNQMDANGDGELSTDELEAAAEARRAARFERMVERLDTDGNGTVSAEEMAAAHDRMGKRGKMGRDHAQGGKPGDKRGGEARLRPSVTTTAACSAVAKSVAPSATASAVAAKSVASSAPTAGRNGSTGCSR